MSNSSQPARPTGETQDGDTAPRSIPTPISQLVLNPVLVENAWTTIKSFLPPDDKLRNVDATGLGGKENVGMTEKQRSDGKASVRKEVGGGISEDDAWEFIRGNVERAMLRRDQSTAIEPLATTTQTQSTSQDQPLSSSNVTNQQPSVTIAPIETTSPSAPIPPSKLLPRIIQKHKTDRTIMERRYWPVEQWVTTQRDRVRDRPGFVEIGFQEARTGTGEGGRGNVGVLTTLKHAERVVERPSSAEGQYPENGKDGGRSREEINALSDQLISFVALLDHTTNVLSASPEPISNDSLSSSPQRHISFDPLADVEIIGTVSPGRQSGTKDISTAGGLDQAASSLTDTAIIEYGTPDTAFVPGSTEVHHEEQQVPVTSTHHTENDGCSKVFPNTTITPAPKAVTTIGNQSNASAQREKIHGKRISLALSSAGQEQKSEDNVCLSTKERNIAVEDGAMSSVLVPGFRRFYSLKAADGVRISASAATVTMFRTSEMDGIRPEVTVSNVRERSAAVTELDRKTAHDHGKQLPDSANGGDLIDFSSEEESPLAQLIEAVDGPVPMDGSSSNISDGGSLPEAKEQREEALASDVQEDGAETDGVDTSTPAAINGEKMAIGLDHETQPTDAAKPGGLDSVSAHAASPSPPSTEATDDRVSTDNVPSNGLDDDGSSPAEKQESSRSPARDGQNGVKEDQIKESAAAASNSPETSPNDTPREKYYFYQSSPTFFLELDPSLSPEERIQLGARLAAWSLQSRIRTAEEILEILQRCSICKDFDVLESFLKQRYLVVVGEIITLPIADALRYVIRDLYVTREESEQARQILQEDIAGNHVPAWRLFQRLILKESRATFVATWAGSNASTIQGFPAAINSAIANHIQQLYDHRILDVPTVRSKIACMLDSPAPCEIEDLCHFVVILCSPPFLEAHSGTSLIEKFLGGLQDICQNGLHSETQRSLLKAAINHCEGIRSMHRRSIDRPESARSESSDGSVKGGINVNATELIGDASSTTEHTTTQWESRLHSNDGASMDSCLCNDRTTKDAIKSDEALQNDHTTEDNAGDDAAASGGEMRQDPQPGEIGGAEEIARSEQKYFFHSSPNDPASQVESYRRVTPLARSLLDKSHAQDTASKLYTLLLQAPPNRQFSTLEAFCKDQFVVFSRISEEIPLGSAWRYFLRGLSVSYKKAQADTCVYHMRAWPFLQSLLLEEKRAEFMSPWSHGPDVEEQVEQMLSRDSGFLSDVCRLYDAHFVTASDGESMIMENLSDRSTAAGVKELCYLSVLYIMRPRRGVVPYHPSDTCATNCLRRLGEATREEGLPKALRDLCQVVVKFCATEAYTTAKDAQTEE